MTVAVFCMTRRNNCSTSNSLYFLLRTSLKKTPKKSERRVRVKMAQDSLLGHYWWKRVKYFLLFTFYYDSSLWGVKFVLEKIEGCKI